MVVTDSIGCEDSVSVTITEPSALSLSTFASAQSYWVTSPPGYRYAAGNYYSRILGEIPSGKVQFRTAGLRDGKRKLMDRIYFRRDQGHRYTARNNLLQNQPAFQTFHCGGGGG